MSAFYDPKLQEKLLFLQKQNQKRSQISLWRCLIVAGIIAGCIAMITTPYWKIKSNAQIIMEEDIALNKSRIHSLLKLNYPQLLWTIPSHQLSSNLKAIPPIVDAIVTKQMFPPQIKVKLQERIPVAMVLSQGKIGFLDADGVWLDAYYYSTGETISGEGEQNSSLPQLKVINFRPQYKDSWAEIYRLLAIYSGIELQELRWDEAAHIYLKTNIGQVYLGGNSSLLSEQFQVLARFPELSTQKNLTKVEYLDLSNPKIPFIQKYTWMQ